MESERTWHAKEVLGKSDMAETEKKVNIAINEEAHTRAKIISTIKKIKMKDYLRKILEDAIKKDEQVLQKIK